MILEKVVVSELEANCYILGLEDSRKAVIIDPGGDAGKIKRKLKEKSLSAAMIINTHGHVDHIGADEAFGVPVYIHADDVKLLGDPERVRGHARTTGTERTGDML